MFEFVVLAIVMLAVAAGAVLSEWDKKSAARTWPTIHPDSSRSDPAEEGATVPGEEPREAERGVRRAA